uniref:Putative dehydrogenase with different specificities related to short-chain alcohol dehydrogenase n=1 Tax=Culex tarsalis TaxID=7177 RepID=A0A1Q3F6R1_CULTA
MGLLSKIAILLGVGTITYVIRWHFIGRLYRSKRTFSSKDLIVITGASSGIGLASVKDLVKRGCHLVLGCRNEAAGQQVCKQLRQQFGPEVLVDVYYVDLGSLKSIVSFVDQVGLLRKPVYALVNNAGIFYAPPAPTADQIEQTFEVNYLGHYLLTILLLPKLKQHPGGSRIVNVVSRAHQAVERFPDTELHQLYDDSPQNRFRAYQYSKFCLVLFAHKLSSILVNSKVTVHCVDPGNVETAIYRHFPQLNNSFLYCLQKPVRLLAVKTPREGAQALLYAVLSDQTPPFYLSSHRPKESDKSEVNPRIYNPILGDTLWTLSRQMCRVHLLEMN